MKNFPKNLSTATKQDVMLDSTRLLLAFKEPTSPEEVSAMIKDFNFQLEDIKEKGDERKHWIQINHTATRYWVRKIDGKDITEEEFSAIQDKLIQHLDWIGPVYSSRHDQGAQTRFCPLPKVLLVEKSEQQRERQDEILKRSNLT